MSDELKPCPFCGGPALIGGLVPWAECAECGASGAAESDDASAAAAWNRRVAPQPPAEAQPVVEAVVWLNPDCEFGEPFSNVQTKRHTVPLYAHPPPSAPVGVEGLVSEMREASKSWTHGAHPMVTCEIAAKRADRLEALARQPAACVGCEGKPTPENTPCAVCGQQPAYDGGFTAADMMDARQEGREEAQQLAGFSAADMADAAAQGFRDGVASVGAAVVDGADKKRLAEALRPLAAMYQPEAVEYMGDQYPDHDFVFAVNGKGLRLGDLRRAAAALRDHDREATND